MHLIGRNIIFKNISLFTFRMRQYSNVYLSNLRYFCNNQKAISYVIIPENHLISSIEHKGVNPFDVSPDDKQNKKIVLNGSLGAQYNF